MRSRLLPVRGVEIAAREETALLMNGVEADEAPAPNSAAMRRAAVDLPAKARPQRTQTLGDFRLRGH